MSQKLLSVVILLIMRSRKIKFAALPNRLLGKDSSAWIATGHYAQLKRNPEAPSEVSLHRATNLLKDQSYYLSTSPITALARTMFPLGGMMKDEVRDLARKWGIHTSEKKESMGICFVGVRKRFDSFLGMS
jgi:tRNA-specific 2-thiouridylase